ncbi:MAG: DUF1553 domain-containing protein [Acidobacteria bacterium]|nr:DUF1553 domain-containing protein [Acidobacteriota bacterium]
MRAIFLIGGLAATAFCQDPVFDPNEKLEKAHRPLIQPPRARSKTAAEVTAEVARRLPASTAATQELAVRSFVDRHILGRMKRDGVPHAPLASDEEFARRAWLDATGRIPPTGELAAFLESKDPNKRDKLIDRLVGSDAFIDKWTFYFEDLWRAGQRMGPGLNLFHFWVREWLKLDRPYNEVVSDLLTGAGKTSFSVPGGLYYARDFVKAKDDPDAVDAHDLVNQPDTVDEFTITYGKVFLGINFACISCHDGRYHLEKVNLFLAGKTRQQFFQQAAFFGKTRQIMNWENGSQANTEYTVDDLGPGYDTKAESIVRVPRTTGKDGRRMIEPRFILTGEAPGESENRRDELARMLTGHIQFARAFANRIWAEFMGFGIVEPVDEFDLARYDPANPPPAPWSLQPSNPELLDALARDFAANHYSFRHLVKAVMKSSAYQLSSQFRGEWKDDYAPYYARKFVRMLSAAELHDAIALATSSPGVPTTREDKPEMVMQMAEPKKAGQEVQNFLRVFGQSNRDEMPKKTPPSSLQAMLLMQSKLVTDGVKAGGGTAIEQLLKETADDRDLVEKIYLATVSRRPSEAELGVALRTLGADRRRGAENLQWALINSPEFIFNY